MSRGPLAEDEVHQFQEDGFCIARGLYDAEEMALLSRAAREDKALDEHAIKRSDGEGGVAKLTLWNHPGDDICGMFSRGRRLVDSIWSTSRWTRATRSTFTAICSIDPIRIDRISLVGF